VSPFALFFSSPYEDGGGVPLPTVPQFGPDSRLLPHSSQNALLFFQQTGVWQHPILAFITLTHSFFQATFYLSSDLWSILLTIKCHFEIITGLLGRSTPSWSLRLGLRSVCFFLFYFFCIQHFGLFFTRFVLFLFSVSGAFLIQALISLLFSHFHGDHSAFSSFPFLSLQLILIPPFPFVSSVLFF